MNRPGETSPWRYVGLGMELAGAVGILTLIGYGIDRWLATAPWGLVAGASVGIVGGLYNLVKAGLKANR